MAKSPPAPELVEAYQLIKCGERQTAGQKLKLYLSQHQTDPDGWWLMAHVVGKPDQVLKCLETVVKLDPNHTKARQKLARLTAAVNDEPDESLIFGSGDTSQAWYAPPVTPPVPKPAPAPPPPRPAPAAPPPAPSPKGGSFEDFLANAGSSVDPFAARPVDDPFASPVQQPFDPLAAAHSIGGYNAKTQAPGTGNQPDWGPGLAFVQDPTGGSGLNTGRPVPPPRPTGAASAPFGTDDFAPDRENRLGAEAVIGIAVIAIAVVVLIGLLAYMADQKGTISLSNDQEPEMTALDGGSFTIDYPTGWDAECKTEGLGYSVCGIANDPFYNEVDWYSDQDVNIGETLSEAFSMAFTGEELPEERVSIIVMDVPPTSAAYDDKSWAKTQYEWSQGEWSFFSEEAKIHYDKKEMTVDGRTAYYYEFIGEDKEWSMKTAYYDVYIQHHDRTMTLWMFVQFSGDIGDKIPEGTIEAMIESIHLKEEW